MSRKMELVEVPYHYALFCTVRRAVRKSQRFARGGDGVLLLRVPLGKDSSDYTTPLMRMLLSEVKLGRKDSGYMTISSTAKHGAILNKWEGDCIEKRRVVIICDKGVMVPTEIALAVDAELDVNAITARDLRAACKMVCKIDCTLEQAQAALDYPSQNLWAALRRGRSMVDVLKRLEEAPTEQSNFSKAETPDVPPLSTMYGYGAAKAWGIELARDLTDWRLGKIDWSQVDKGIVLSGPPGVGKTIFAKALARECDVPIVASSLGRWQSTGHLGDLLKAMRRDFNQAKESAPSIMFVDELDSFGDRNSFTSDYKDYSIQVVNAFLECLDGADGREGVVVIGATNNIGTIDPAILRPGRLDRHVVISLPNAGERIGILRQHMGDAIPLDELTKLVASTNGYSGADLAKVARDAKRIARRARRSPIMEDVIEALPEMIQVTGKLRRACAVHEAGHAVAVLRMGIAKFQGAMIAEQVRNDSTTEVGGGAFFELANVGHRDAKFYRDYILTMLAGIAAETVMLGSFTDGAGAGKTSDLATATRLATAMQTMMGMGSRLRHSLAKEDVDLEKLRHVDQSVASWVDEVLATEFARAKALIEANRSFLIRIADALEARGKVSADEVAALEQVISDHADAVSAA